MTFSMPYGSYNAKTTLNGWFTANITGAGTPAWMTSARVLFDWGKENEIIEGYSGAAFTVWHLPPSPIQTYEGRNTIAGSAGQTMMGIMDISCWVSKEYVGEDYPIRLGQMGDMVETLMTSAREVELQNYYTSTAAPSGIGALVRVGEPESRVVVEDTNPDTRRKRYIVEYRWLERV